MKLVVGNVHVRIMPKSHDNIGKETNTLLVNLIDEFHQRSGCSEVKVCGEVVCSGIPPFTSRPCIRSWEELKSVHT